MFCTLPGEEEGQRQSRLFLMLGREKLRPRGALSRSAHPAWCKTSWSGRQLIGQLLPPVTEEGVVQAAASLGRRHAHALVWVPQKSGPHWDIWEGLWIWTKPSVGRGREWKQLPLKRKYERTARLSGPGVRRKVEAISLENLVLSSSRTLLPSI